MSWFLNFRIVEGQRIAQLGQPIRIDRARQLLAFALGLDEAGVGHSPELAKKDKTLLEPVRANVRAVAQDLLKQSKVVEKAIQDKKISIAEGVYFLNSGKVDFRD